VQEAVIRSALAVVLQTKVADAPLTRVSGGNIHQCFRCPLPSGEVFVKAAAPDSLPMLSSEAAALQELAGASALRVPSVLGVGKNEGCAILVLEWIALSPPSPAVEWQLGERLADQHRVTNAKYGWRHNNYIGSTLQPNVWSTDWLHFWRTHRFDVQLDLAARNGADARFLERATLLSALMDGFFTSYIPQPSLLHGDLWSGNRASDERNRPVVFDPASYFGDREVDLAMTRLFGGFSPEFYAAYQRAWPLDAGAAARVDLYNLYHVLNHHALFGGEYLQRASAMVDKLLAETGH